MVNKVGRPVEHTAEYLRANGQRVEDMTFEIEGLEATGDGYFKLKNVPTVEMPYVEITRLLTDRGVPLVDAERYVEEFANTVTVGELAKVFARRARRVG